MDRDKLEIFNLIHRDCYYWLCSILWLHKEHRKLRTQESQNSKTRKDFFVQVRNPFYYFWVKGFDIRRETQSFYAGFFIWPLSRAAPMARKFVSPQRAPKVEPPRSASSFNSSNFLQILKNLRALPVRDVTRTLSPVSSSQAIVTFLSDMSALCARTRYHLHQGCT